MRKGFWNTKGTLDFADIENISIREFVNKTTEPVLSSFTKDSDVTHPEADTMSLSDSVVTAQLQLVFDNQLGQLQAVKTHLERKIEALVIDREDVGRECKEKQERAELQSKEIGVQYTRLEEKLVHISNMIVSLGDTLEQMDVQKRRSDELLTLLQYFLSFSPEASWVYEKRNKELLEDRNRNHEAAILLQKLNDISQNLSDEMYKDIKVEIQKACDLALGKLVDEMVKGYEHNDKRRIAKCAKTYEQLDSCDLCIRQYISLVFKEYDRKYETTGLYLESKNTKSETLSKRRFSAVVTACLNLYKLLKEKIPVILETFSYADKVVHSLIQRIFQERLQGLIFKILQDEMGGGNGPFLFSLYSVYSEVINFSKKVKNLVSVPLKGVYVDPLQIDAFVVEIFAEMKEPYINTELAYLGETYEEKLMSWNNIVFLDSDSYNLFEEDVFNHPIIQTLFAENAEAINRCLNLSKVEDLSDNMWGIYFILLRDLGRKALSGVLNVELELLMSQAKGNNDAVFDDASRRFIHISIGISRCFNKLEAFYTNNIAKYLADSVNLKTYAANMRNDVKLELQLIACRGFESCIQSWCACIEAILRQKKVDYRSLGMEDINQSSVAVTEAVASIASKRHIIVDTMKLPSPKNCEQILAEFGESIYNMFLGFLSKQHGITPFGGFRLIKDVGLLREELLQFQSPVLKEKIDILEEIAKIYIMDPKNVKTLLYHGVLVKMPEGTLHRLVKLRSDYKSARIAKQIKGDAAQG